MSVQEIRRQSIIFLTPKPSQKKFPNQLEFLYGFLQPQTLTPLITLYGVF